MKEVFICFALVFSFLGVAATGGFFPDENHPLVKDYIPKLEPVKAFQTFKGDYPTNNGNWPTKDDLPSFVRYNKVGLAYFEYNGQIVYFDNDWIVFMPDGTIKQYNDKYFKENYKPK